MNLGYQEALEQIKRIWSLSKLQQFSLIINNVIKSIFQIFIIFQSKKHIIGAVI